MGEGGTARELIPLIKIGFPGSLGFVKVASKERFPA
jgi:hypothetical protein